MNTTRKPPPDIVFDSPPCPVCPGEGNPSCDNTSWRCEDCLCTWGADGTGGEWGDAAVPALPVRNHTDIPWRQLMRRVGKKAAGRLLDGRTWDEYPAVTR